MKSIIALVFVGLMACTYAGFVSPFGYYSAALPAYQSALPYAAIPYSTLGPNYQLKLDTTLPGSAYASYPYAAAPTAYGYGVVKTL